MRFKSRLLLIAALCLPAFPALAADEALTPAQKTAVEAVIGDYLKQNPEIVIQAIEAYRAKQEQAMKDQADASIKKNMDFLAAADAPSTGNPKASVTVVEFFDYNCGYCKHALPDVMNELKTDKDLRVVFHEMPILADTSHEAAKWALAAHKQGKYFEFHAALMGSPAPRNAETFEKISKDIGLDVEKMKKDAASPEVAAMIEKSVGVAREIGINGTPAFIINGTLYPGYLGPDGLKDAIEKAHGKGDNKEG